MLFRLLVLLTCLCPMHQLADLADGCTAAHAYLVLDRNHQGDKDVVLLMQRKASHQFSQ